MRITTFSNVHAKTIKVLDIPWDELVEQCRNPTTYPSKAACPLIKLAVFGDIRTSKKSLRHDGNIKYITGIEGDYDSEIMSPYTAKLLLEDAGIGSLIYTTPTHTAEKPHWRVLVPLSCEQPPSARRKFVAQVNGALGGILAPESFTLSQAYFFGCVNGVEYKSFVTEGEYIDWLPELQEEYPAKAASVHPPQEYEERTAPPEIIEELRSALKVMPADDYHTWISVGHALYGLGDVGYKLWAGWSATSAKHNPDADLSRWSTFSGDRTGFPAVFAKAKIYGWVNPKARQADDISGIFDTDVFSATTLPECTAQSDDEIIRYLAKLKPFEYDRVRKERATALKVQIKTLDGMVKGARSDESEAERLPFAEVEPYTEPIDPAQLLNEVSSTIRLFIVLDTEQAHAAALWCALTWFIDVVEVAPLAIINAPEKSCGKTQLLTVLGRMVYRPLPASNASPSALFRAVELWKPTILIDEADTFFRDNFELHGMVNAGYSRDGFVLRSEPVGDTFEPRTFSVFSAKALAGIALEKHLPESTMSRGVVFNLRRKLSHESVSRLRHAGRDLFTAIAEKLARFAVDYSQQVRTARLSLPDALSDRDQDNWDGLLAVASCAGDEWLARATAAALKLSSVGEKTQSTGNELLSDIQHIFESKNLTKISFADLINSICDDEETGWATYNRGKPITPRQVSKRLKEYGISSKSIRFGYDGVQKGFDIEQFDDAFARYLKKPCFPVTGLQPNNGNAFDVTNKNDVTVTQSNPGTSKPNKDGACNHVTGKTPISGVDDECEVEL